MPGDRGFGHLFRDKSRVRASYTDGCACVKMSVRVVESFSRRERVASGREAGGPDADLTCGMDVNRITHRNCSHHPSHEKCYAGEPKLRGPAIS